MTVQIDEAMDALRCLLRLRDGGVFTDAEFFHAVAESGPLGRIEIEACAAMGTNGVRHFYKPSRNLAKFLAAVSARDRDGNDPSQFADESNLRSAHD